ncbi:MAG TPA: MtrB/PioB family decaheme-associated outer membrane protein [Methylomirabilota bacterium]|nr:MtrB/PioB family decaheme-associated outer membrane protein [Methylomirabilota bacterium]
MRIQRAAGWLIGGVGLVVGTLAWAPSASGQLSLGGFNLEGDVEAGVRAFIERPSPSRRGKFEEYRDIDQGPFLGEFQLRFFRPDESYSVTLGGSKWGQDDQEYVLRAGRLGLWEFGFAWDQTPHLLSTTARTRAVEVSPGEWRLPARPTATSISAAEGALYNAAPELDEVGVRWDTARISLLVTPRPDLDFRADYARIHKDGTQPFGMAMGSPGNDFIEVLEPIDHTIHDFRLRGTIARDTWQLQAGYIFSRFENSNDRVIADNPLRSVFAAFAPSATGGSSSPAFGRSSLAPDNMAHTIQISGGVDLPWRTRLSSGFSYSLRLQDDDFLPHTINPNIPTALLTLPQESLDGIVGITAINLSLVNRAIPRTTLSLRYRFFDHSEMTDEVVFPGHAVNDQALSNEERRTSAFDHSRHNLDLDAKYRPISGLATTLGGGWEHWKRDEEHREVPKSDEYYLKAALDWTPLEWLLTRLTYKPSWRRIDEYNTFAHIAHTVLEEELSPTEQAQSQSLLLRKFDQGERDRQQLDLTLQFTPLDTVTLTANGMWRNDDYLGGQFGLRDATTWSAGFDVSWSPTERVALFAGYVYEYIYQKFASRNRDVATVAGQSIVSDFEDWNWLSVNLDRVQTAHIGAKVGIIPNKLDWTVQAGWSYAFGEVDTRNETAPLPHPPGFPNPANAVARRQPAFEDMLVRLDTAFRYWVTRQWAVSFGYAFETFKGSDWRTDGLNPFVPGSNSIRLGNDSRNYTAHIVGATVRYVFK